MSSTRQPPTGTPALATHAGLTPQMSIVDANGRPTMFFFRWLLTLGGVANASSDSSILESFDPGADAALAESAIADALDAAGTAAGFDDGGAARAALLDRIDELALAGALRFAGRDDGPSSEQRAFEALLMGDAPVTPVTPVTRDVFANLPTGLNEGDTGRLFYATDRKLTYIWTGAAWQIVVNYEPVIADTLANWTAANYSPANYAPGQQFLVTSWHVTYTALAGVWTYSSGTYIALAAARPATAFNGAPLGVADAGLRFLASDTLATSYWTGAAWAAYPAVSGAPPTGPAGGDLSGTYPNPTVAQASGNFLVLGVLLTQQNLAGSVDVHFNYQAGQHAVITWLEAAVGKAQFGISAGSSYWDYSGTWNIRAGYGGATIAAFDPAGNLTLSQLLTLTGRAVAALPASPVLGQIACVNNALAPVAGSAVVGGGSAKALVWWNGAQWSVFGV